MQYESTYLAHHGILGMKWGIRRYQNYDGSYTKRGMKRYNESQAEVNEKKASLKAAKEAYKTGSGTKLQVNEAKNKLKRAEFRRNADYKHLKQDKLADKGRDQYAQGKTITGSRNKANGVALLTLGASLVAKQALAGKGYLQSPRIGNKVYQMDYGDAAAAAVTVAGLAAIEASFGRQQRQLRAYYGHTSYYKR